MESTPDEARLKELIKAAVAEALDERQAIKNKKSEEIPKVILLWVLILVTAVGIYNLVERVAFR